MEIRFSKIYLQILYKKPQLLIEMQPFRFRFFLNFNNKIYSPDGCILAYKKIVIQGDSSLFCCHGHYFSLSYIC